MFAKPFVKSGYGLVQQHSQTIYRGQTCLSGLLQKRRFKGGIDNVGNHGVAGQLLRVDMFETGVVHADGCGIDQQIRCSSVFVEMFQGPGIDPFEGKRNAQVFCQCFGLVATSIEKYQPVNMVIEQGNGYGPGGSPGPQQDDGCAFLAPAGCLLVQIGHETGTIRIVADDLVTLHVQGIDGSDGFCLRGQVITQFANGNLVGNGYIAADIGAVADVPYQTGQLVGPYGQGQILSPDVMFVHPEGMNERRAGMSDGVAGNEGGGNHLDLPFLV